jgi:hypothetical protein
VPQATLARNSPNYTLREVASDEAMMQVNMTSLVDLTHLYLQGMVSRESGRILHVASTAGFMPGPLQAVYYTMLKGDLIKINEPSLRFVLGEHRSQRSFPEPSDARTISPPFSATGAHEWMTRSREAQLYVRCHSCPSLPATRSRCSSSL